MSRVIKVGAGWMESILQEGLRVLTFPDGGAPEEGEPFIMEETNEDKPTGRRFYARAMHVPDPKVVQFDLQAFMEDTNPETGKPERFPMAGEFANEKHDIPANATLLWNLEVKGEKPIWIYRGIKWVQEISISRLFFGTKGCKAIQDAKPEAPGLLYIKINGQGGESEHAYRYAGPARPQGEGEGEGKLE